MEHYHHHHHHHNHQQKQKQQQQQHYHHHYHSSRNQTFSSALLDAICNSTFAAAAAASVSSSSSSVSAAPASASFASDPQPRSFCSGLHLQQQLMQQQHSRFPRNEAERCFSASNFNYFYFDSESSRGVIPDASRDCRHCFSSATATATYSSDCSDSNSAYLSSDAESIYRSSNNNNPSKRSSSKPGWVSSCMALRAQNASQNASSSAEDFYSNSFRSIAGSAQEAPKFKWRHKNKKDSSSTKKTHHPNSPGKKLASFLNSLFTAGATKKPKISSSSSSSFTVTNSSASSSKKQKSCLSKNSYTAAPHNSNGSARSVRFSCAANESVYQESKKPHQRVHRSPVISDDSQKVSDLGFSRRMRIRLLERDSDAAATAAQNIIAKYSHDANKILQAVARDLDKLEEEEEERKEEEDDNVSCSSSDLFELENLSAIDMKKYQEELPVYETTRFDTSKSLLARGLRY